MGKWKKRIKKALKTAAKVAAIGGAGVLGAKAFGGKQGVPLGIAGGGVDRLARAQLKHDAGVLSAKHDSESAMAPEKKWYSKIFKKGGRVTGIAKRGFGRALMKGKK